MIEIKNIKKIYDFKVVLDNFSLKIEDKQRVVLFGKSGSGKSTLLRIIAGLESIDDGEIYIDGVLVSKKNKIIIKPHQRGVGMVFQELALWPHMDVYENIEFGLKMKDIPKEQRKKDVLNILKKVKMQEFYHRDISELSGGQKQRVALARTLVTKPKIVLMDEALSSLDYELGVELRGVILELQKEFGFTLVYVTHFKEEAEFLADRIIYL